MTVKETEETMAEKGSSGGGEVLISDPQLTSETLNFIGKFGMSKPIPQICNNTTGFYSHFFGTFIKVDLIQRGRISCTLSVKPQISVIPFSFLLSYYALQRFCLPFILLSFCVCLGFSLNFELLSNNLDVIITTRCWH